MCRRAYQRTVDRPGEICQLDLWQPSRPIPVGFGQTRPGYVAIAYLGYSRAGAGALLFSKEAPDMLWGVGRCLWASGGLPATLVWDREGALHACGDRPSEAFAGFRAGYCGLADWPSLLRDRPLGLSTPNPAPTVRPCDIANESVFLRPRQQSR